MVIGLIGILKAGGAYLPLDPGYPTERLAFMLADANAPVLVTHSALLDRLPAHHAQTVHMDADWSTIAQQPATTPAIRLQPKNPAYVIYTSGSTGIPKGVMVTHQNVARLFGAIRTLVPFRLQTMSGLVPFLCLRLLRLEIWGPLLHGGRLVVVPYSSAAHRQSS